MIFWDLEWWREFVRVLWRTGFLTPGLGTNPNRRTLIRQAK
jgi:hypothetical protein